MQDMGKTLNGVAREFDARVEHAGQKINDIKKRIEELNFEIGRGEGFISRWQEVVDKKKAEVEEIKKELKGKRGKVRQNILNDINKLEAGIITVENNIKSRQQKIDALQKELDNLGVENKMAENEIQGVEDGKEGQDRGISGTRIHGLQLGISDEISRAIRRKFGRIKKDPKNQIRTSREVASTEVENALRGAEQFNNVPKNSYKIIKTPNEYQHLQDLADLYGVPLFFYETDLGINDPYSAFFNRVSGIVFIRKDFQIVNKETADIILKHEFVHSYQSRHKEYYDLNHVTLSNNRYVKAIHVALLKNDGFSKLEEIQQYREAIAVAVQQYYKKYSKEFATVLEYKKNPTAENIKEIESYLQSENELTKFIVEMMLQMAYDNQHRSDSVDVEFSENNDTTLPEIMNYPTINETKKEKAKVVNNIKTEPDKVPENFDIFSEFALKNLHKAGMKLSDTQIITLFEALSDPKMKNNEVVRAIKRSRPIMNMLEERAKGIKDAEIVKTYLANHTDNASEQKDKLGWMTTSWLSDLIVPVLTRIYNISEKAHNSMLWYEFGFALNLQERMNEITPYANKFLKLPKEVRNYLDLSLKNSNTSEINRIHKEHKMESEYKQLRKILDDIHAEAKSVGFELGYLEDYWPRVFMSKEEVDRFIISLEKAHRLKDGELLKLLEDYRAKHKQEPLDLELQEMIVSKIPNYERRSNEFIDFNMNKVIYPAIEGLSQYIYRATQRNHVRKFLGYNTNLDTQRQMKRLTAKKVKIGEKILKPKKVKRQMKGLTLKQAIRRYACNNCEHWYLAFKIILLLIIFQSRHLHSQFP